MLLLLAMMAFLVSRSGPGTDMSVPKIPDDLIQY